MDAERIDCRFCMRPHGPGATVCGSCGAPLVGPAAEAVSRPGLPAVELGGEGAGGPPPVSEDALLAAARQQAARNAKASSDPVTMFLLVLCCALILSSAMRGTSSGPSTSSILPSAPPRPLVAPRQVAYAASSTLGLPWMSGRSNAIVFQPPANWHTARPLYGAGGGHVVSMTQDGNADLALVMYEGEPLTGDPLKAATARLESWLPGVRVTDGRAVRIGMNSGVELEGTASDRKMLAVFVWNAKRSAQLAFLAPHGQYAAWVPIFRTSAATTTP